MIIDVESDTTILLPCRKGDVFAWVKYAGGAFVEEAVYTIPDVWIMNEGDSLLMTNRLEDLPDTYQLYPTKVTGRNVPIMKQKLENGFDTFSIDTDLDHQQYVWKLNISDYLVWLGGPMTWF